MSTPTCAFTPKRPRPAPGLTIPDAGRVTRGAQHGPRRLPTATNEDLYDNR
jgi:hypothetical protein